MPPCYPRGGARARLVQTGWDVPLAYEASVEPARLEAGQVRVAVDACGVCHRDLLDREGRFPFLRLPVTPGHEAAGRVVEVGAGVTAPSVGDHVATMHRDACGACPACARGDTTLCTGAAWVLGILADGGYASEIVLPASALYPVPADLPPAHAAVLHCTFGTAYRDLATLAKLQAGERVLVTGANGGVGVAAVQVAARLGAHVVALVRDAAHEPFLRSLGAREVVTDAKAVSPVDVAIDTVGAPTFLGALHALQVGGRVVTLGNVTRDKVPLNLGLVITKGLSILGGSGATAAEMRAVLAMHAERPFHVAIARTLPLARADEAQRLVRQGGLVGRVVLDTRRG
ncbi:MAG TPA: alcohol dehydrogenase catalytic domain-containing protein [Polyangiaceae bacterium]